MSTHCPCAPDESGNIVHNRWWHEANDPEFLTDPHTYASTEDVLRAAALIKARNPGLMQRLADS